MKFFPLASVLSIALNATSAAAQVSPSAAPIKLNSRPTVESTINSKAITKRLLRCFAQVEAKSLWVQTQEIAFETTYEKLHTRAREVLNLVAYMDSMFYAAEILDPGSLTADEKARIKEYDEFVKNISGDVSHRTLHSLVSKAESEFRAAKENERLGLEALRKTPIDAGTALAAPSKCEGNLALGIQSLKDLTKAVERYTQWAARAIAELDNAEAWLRGHWLFDEDDYTSSLANPQ